MLKGHGFNNLESSLFTFFYPVVLEKKSKTCKKKKTDNLRDEQTVEQPDNRRQVIRKTHLNHRFRWAKTIKLYCTCESLKKLNRRTSSNSNPLAQSMVKTRHFWNVDFTIFFVSSLATKTTWCAPRSIFDVSLSFSLRNKWSFLKMNR